MPEFLIPTSPADGDLYNTLLDAELRVVELRRRYHEAECAQLEQAWCASSEQAEEQDCDGL